MDRRAVIAGAGAASLGALAGCIAGSTSLAADDVVREDDEAYVRLRDGAGETVATVDVAYDRPGPARWTLDCTVSHDDATRLSSMRFDVDAPARWSGSGGPPTVSVALEEPGGGPWPPISFDGTGRRTTVSVDGLGGLGAGTLQWTLHLSASERVDDLPIRVAASCTLERDGAFAGSYEADASLDFTLD